MKMVIFLASAATLAVAAPAFAKPGNGQGHGNSAHPTMAHGNSAHATMAHGSSAHATIHGRSNAGVIRTSNGRLYALDRRGGCPPGLAKQGTGCLPPGQAKKLYSIGQRYNRNFGYRWTYDQIPVYLRDQYRFDPAARYYYRNGYLYQVDPQTMLVQQAISALLR